MATESPNVEMTEEDVETRSFDTPSSENQSDIGENQRRLDYVKKYPRDEITVTWKPEISDPGTAGRIERHDVSFADMFEHDSALLRRRVDEAHISWIHVHSTNVSIPKNFQRTELRLVLTLE